MTKAKMTITRARTRASVETTMTAGRDAIRAAREYLATGKGGGWFFADLDEETDTYGVFHTESEKMYASFCDESDAKELARRWNEFSK